MPRLKKTEVTSRLNLQLSANTRKLIEKLQFQIDCDSMTEVVRRAIAAYDFIATESEKGSTFFIERDGVKTGIKFIF